jgi:hypothetical protein
VWSASLNFVAQLFGLEGDDGSFAGGLDGWSDAKDNADTGRHANGQGNGVGRKDRGDIGEFAGNTSLGYGGTNAK